MAEDPIRTRSPDGPRPPERAAVVDERLESGWDEMTAPDDTLVRAATLHLAAAAGEMAVGAGGVSEVTRYVALADAGSPSPFLNVATAIQPDFDPAEIDRFFASRPGGGYLLLSPFPTRDLRPDGWELVGHPPVMYRPPGERALPTGGGGEPPELAVARVDDDAGLADFEGVLVEGYPLPELAPARPGCMAGPAQLANPRFAAYVGRVDGTAVAASAVHSGPGLVVVSWVATLPGYRGRGYGAALTRRAIDTDPDLGAVLLASDPGRPVYERMGFVALLRFTAWQRASRPPGP